MRPYQTRKQSLFEALFNIGSGFVVAYFIWIAIVPFIWPHLKSNYSDAFGLTCLFTIASIIRSYIWRRIMEHIH